MNTDDLEHYCRVSAVRLRREFSPAAPAAGPWGTPQLRSGQECYGVEHTHFLLSF